MKNTRQQAADFKTDTIEIPSYLRVSKIIAYIMYAWVFIGIVLLTIRVVLLMFSANVATPFVEFVYRTSVDYLAPFRGIFPPRTIGETGYLDVAALFAVVMYLLLAWAFASLVNYIQYKIDQEVAHRTPIDEPLESFKVEIKK